MNHACRWQAIRRSFAEGWTGVGSGRSGTEYARSVVPPECWWCKRFCRGGHGDTHQVGLAYAGGITMRPTTKLRWFMSVTLLGVIASIPLQAAADPINNPAEQRRQLQQYAADTWQSFV